MMKGKQFIGAFLLSAVSSFFFCGRHYRSLASIDDKTGAPKSSRIRKADNTYVLSNYPLVWVI